MKDYLKQFLLDCWYAPLWLKLTNAGWLAILVAIIWGGTVWMVDFYETTTIDPNSVLGVLASFLPIVVVATVFIARSTYEWVVTRILRYFGFIEEPK